MSTRRRSDRGRTRQRGLVAFTVAVALARTTLARADEVDLSMYRDRFRLGMDRYKSGEVAEAIRVWSAIYEELGTKRGYRLAFDLARAYDSNGEATRAAERYRSFLEEAAARRTAGEKLESLVEREVQDADERMRELNRTHGRIQIDAHEDATLAQVDDTDPRLGTFTAYVAPGRHVVTFGPGKEDAEKVEVVVAAGELVLTRGSRRPGPVTPAASLLTLDPLTKRVTKHPFSPVWLYAGIAATAGSVLAPVIAYDRAASIYNTYSSLTALPTQKNNAAATYPAARTLAYGMLALPISVGVVTGGLTTWYFAGAHEQTVVISLTPSPQGPSGTMTVRF